MKSTKAESTGLTFEKKWALVNKKTGELYRNRYGKKNVITYNSREDARLGKWNAMDYKVGRVNITYERIS